MSGAQPANGPAGDGEGTLAIIAGAGALPWEAADVIARRRKIVVFAVDGEADAGPASIETHRIGPGQIGRMRRIAIEHGCRDVLLIGAIRSRPDFASIIPDLETLRLLPRIVRAAVGGDDTVVRNVIGLFEQEGFRVVSVAEAAPELLAAPGPVGARQPDAKHEADIALGMRYLDASSPFDVGQCVAVVDGRVIAVEGAEGTDAMLARVADIRRARRFRSEKGAGVLVKRAKTGQDMRSDVPVIGADTLRGAIKAGLGGIAVEAGRTIIAERVVVAAEADRARVFVVAR
ncbi:DUF1009 domain-containing protein [Acuticoccus sediminis]|uniref:DUF1009 domain-containing protein n=1 Tax=Acuticoccus sediminis TaxID=2184697 RepID=A0A8B2NMG0_9HYPH|nr:UDP-2,3-diacylglucosamine diphosphatase LpxI [Acuticoccus sediminis]RAH99810.1 DUF1009 domain-containing protein [Acuticoccus sediminis]